MAEKSFQSLINSINKNFYRIVNSREKMYGFISTLADVYCKEHQLPHPSIFFVNYKNWGSYLEGVIKLNENFLKVFDKMASENNFYYLQFFLDTFIHELRHHAQYCNLSTQNGILKNYVEITNVAVIQNHVISNYSYHLEPGELDARYSSYSILRKNKLFKKYYERENYISNEIDEAQSEPFDFVGFLKDPFVQTKSPPLALVRLENEVKSLAKRHHLVFVPGKTEPKTNKVRINNNKINFYIDKTIAPKFYEKSFAHLRSDPGIFDFRIPRTILPPKQEKELDDEEDSFRAAIKKCKKDSTLTERLLDVDSADNFDYLSIIGK